MKILELFKKDIKENLEIVRPYIIAEVGASQMSDFGKVMPQVMKQGLSVEDVKKSDAREALKQRLISSISQVFPSKPEWEDPEPIKKVLFEEFVIQ